MNAKDIFLQAIELEAGEKRQAFVDRQCDGDAALRRRVDALLAAHDEPDSYLERPAARFDVAATLDGEGSGSGLSDSSSHHGRFLPGTKVANRYRIVSMLGRGGMGEVYRADDLRLGQTVALKFLPPELAKDPKRLEYFHNEVRLARQVSHPNVCRVYDIGEVDGQQYISMEYIDGEDLKALLQRIDRLPNDKGVQTAQQLCAGLAAAHARGVLHRDLKPANIMIDGQGQVRITDFGLATATGNGEATVGMSGTPAYMAPEQLLRGTTTVQSDLYALGLILFEIFTGKPAHAAKSLEELRRYHQESSSPNFGKIDGEQVDPAVVRAIRQCLEPDPSDRPSSASVLTASLPGGDPLAAALAAGETPSAELVAASGGVGTLGAWTVLAYLMGVILSIGVFFNFSSSVHLGSLAQIERPPEFLRERAKDIVDELGYSEVSEAGKAAGFTVSWSAFRYIRDNIEANPDVAEREWYRKSPWSVLEFWYRQSPTALVSHAYRHGEHGSIRTRVTEGNPAWDQEGMIGVRLSPEGHLRSFTAFVTPGPSTDAGGQDSDFSEWFTGSLIGFDLTALEPCSETGTPPRVAYDRLQAWVGNWPDSDVPLHVVAASHFGKPVYFKVLSPDQTLTVKPRSAPRGTELWAFWIPALSIVAALCLASVHYFTGRGDRRGAFRLASCVFLAECLAWVLDASHVLDDEATLVRIALANALFDGSLAGMMYLAVEPLARKDWPELLISLSRLLQGRFSDARIGRDALVGTLMGTLVINCFYVTPKLFGRHRVLWNDLSLLADNTSIVSTVLGYVRQTGVAGLSILFMFWVCFKLTRSKLATFAIMVFLGTVVIASPRGFWTFALPWQVISMVLLMGVIARFGILAGGFGLLSGAVLSTPITSDPQSFFYRDGLLALAILVGVALFGAYTSLGLGRRPWLPRHQ